MKYLVVELMFKAVSAWYEDGRICILMADKKEIRFPVELNRKLKDAPVEKVKNVELICDGTGLHWPDLDEDLSVTGILEEKYGH